MAKPARTLISRPHQRANPLRETRNLKMASSAHAYVRDNTLKFDERLDTTDRRDPDQTVIGNPAHDYCGRYHGGYKFCGLVEQFGNSTSNASIDEFFGCFRAAGVRVVVGRKSAPFSD